MDAQDRGQAGEFDSADQWVLNPRTGHYELRLDRSPEQSASSRPRGAGGGAPRAEAPDPGGPRNGAAQNGPARTSSSRAENGPGPAPGAAERAGAAPRPDLPAQRSRRARDAADAALAAGRRKRRPGKPGRRRALLWSGGMLALLIAGGSVGSYLVYQHLSGNIDTIDIGGAGSGGFKKDRAVNVLVIGTDKRTGSGNESYGDKDSVGHAETTILFHVSKDRTNATALSIPRDMITDIPDCVTRTPDGIRVIAGTAETRFNQSLGQLDRDPGCTMRTVTKITGLTVDHFMMADFNAVKTLTTALDGVEVCLAKDVDDPSSRLRLTAGDHKLQGEQALAFVRTRKSFGNRSDLDRIQTQQQFLGSMIRKMKSGDTLTSPGKLWKLAEAATEALTVDTGIGTIERLRDLGTEMAKVDPKNITFATVPVVDSEDGATVLLNEAEAEPLFALMRSDTSLSEVKQKEAFARSERERLLRGPRADPADVHVDVYNGGGPQGAAQETLAWLQDEQGVPRSANRGNAPARVPRTTLEYAPDQAGQARALADMMGLPAAALKRTAGGRAGLRPMSLTLGPDFRAAGVSVGGPAEVPEGVRRMAADKRVCAK
ncbi:LCP family protein [Streptomyces sp. NPDC006923]|uniref:LCP family protein n=1 Tax=Streptomyces sp. NPDC006923 TaxID=3155355 RepID=UPI0033DC582D